MSNPRNKPLSLLAGLLFLAVYLAVVVFSPANSQSTRAEKSFVLATDIYGNLSRYQPLITALTTASKGDIIHITLDHNNGGYVTNEYMVMEAIDQSKATVVTSIRGWAYSAAFSIWLAGDQVIIPKRAEYQPAGLAHLSSPRTKGSIERDIRYSQFYKRFMTPREWNRMVAGEDVWLTGKGMCNTAHASVIEENDNYCIVKTVRYFDFRLKGSASGFHK